MSTTPKAVRRVAKQLSASVRKEAPISLKGATKKVTQKHAKKTEKSFGENYKHSSRKTLSSLGR